MERYIGLDAHAASCTVAIISQAGKRLKDFPVETNGQALVEAIRMIPGRKYLVFEEGEPNEAMAERGPDGRMVPTTEWRTRQPSNRRARREPEAIV